MSDEHTEHSEHSEHSEHKTGLPAVIYGHAPVPQHAWHHTKKVQVNTDYKADECRNMDNHRANTPLSRLQARYLTLETPAHHGEEFRSGHDRAALRAMGVQQAQTQAQRTVTEIAVPQTAHTVYCIKTGQPIGSMVQAYQYPPHAVAPAWLATDGVNLDHVQDHDPRAYVAFCLGIMDAFWRREKRAHRQKPDRAFMSREDAVEHHWSLVRAYELLGQCTEVHLIELANALCRFITYAPLSYRVLERKFMSGKRAADEFAESAVAGKLLASLDKSTVRTLGVAENFGRSGASVKTPKFEIIPKSINDAAKGPSNVRSQTKSRDYQKNAKQNKLMADILREFGGSLGWTNIQEKRPSQASSLLKRISSQNVDANVSRAVSSDAEENDLLADLDRIMTGSTSYAYEETDEDDTVEIRTIPRALVESLQPSKPETLPEIAPSEPAPVAPVKKTGFSLLERLAMKGN